MGYLCANFCIPRPAYILELRPMYATYRICTKVIDISMGQSRPIQSGRGPIVSNFETSYMRLHTYATTTFCMAIGEVSVGLLQGRPQPWSWRMTLQP